VLNLGSYLIIIEYIIDDLIIIKFIFNDLSINDLINNWWNQLIIREFIFIKTNTYLVKGHHGKFV